MLLTVLKLETKTIGVAKATPQLKVKNETNKNKRVYSRNE